MIKFEKIILKNLLRQEKYTRKVLPYIKPDMFQEAAEQVVFEEIQKYVIKYSRLPSAEIIHVAVHDRTNLTEQLFKDVTVLIDELAQDRSESELDWLIDETEKFCRDKSVYLAMLESISIIDGKHKKLKKEAIPELLANALSVSFDNTIGLDFLADAERQYKFYHNKQDRIPFDLEYFNKITGGGLAPKTLFVIMAGTNIGKSLMMCHFAASYLLQQKNVLYITLEMSEEKVTQRIQANLLDVNMNDLLVMPKNIYDKRMKELNSKTKGKLITREYPTSCAHTGHFRALLQELFIKKQFKPDVIFVDYINLCASSRYTNNPNINSYGLVKAVSEELRGLGVEANTRIVTATQFNRDGFSNSDPGMEDVSESFALTFTADVIVAAISSEELEQHNQFMIKHLKNRDEDVTKYRKFIVGVSRVKQRLYDVAPKEQTLTDAGHPELPEDKPLNRFGEGTNYDKFKNFGEENESKVSA